MKVQNTEKELLFSSSSSHLVSPSHAATSHFVPLFSEMLLVGNTWSAKWLFTPAERQVELTKNVCPLPLVWCISLEEANVLSVLQEDNKGGRHHPSIKSASYHECHNFLSCLWDCPSLEGEKTYCNLELLNLYNTWLTWRANACTWCWPLWSWSNLVLCGGTEFCQNISASSPHVSSCSAEAGSIYVCCSSVCFI